MKLSHLTTAAAITAAITLAATAQNNIVEEVAWWIGDQPIYKSEVEEAYQNLLFERQDINGDPYCIIPERLAMERLFLHQAELDSIDIPQAQVTMMVDQQINYLTNNLGSKEKVEEFYRRPLPEIRTLLRELITNRQKVEQVQNSLTQDFKSTPSDVRKYFQTLPEDSIPFVPMQVEVQIMTLNPVIPREEIDEVKARLRDFTDI